MYNYMQNEGIVIYCDVTNAFDHILQDTIPMGIDGDVRILSSTGTVCTQSHRIKVTHETTNRSTLSNLHILLCATIAILATIETRDEDMPHTRQHFDTSMCNVTVEQQSRPHRWLH
jgi:hypothetical protein